MRPEIPRRRAKWPRTSGVDRDAGDDRLDDAVVDDVADDDATDADEPVSRGGAAHASRPAGGVGGQSRTTAERTRAGWASSRRIARFFREVVAELRKVIWPTRKELLTYTAVVVVFVAVMLTIVAGLDFVFAKGVLCVFGNPGLTG